jgi:chloramphenicol 3-O-phosphotransferase
LSTVDEVQQPTTLVLFGGPAGAGKSTLARAWCATRPQAAHIKLDAVRQLIINGRADPQEPGESQAAQYRLSVSATCALARPFSEGGYDVAVDDVFEPEAFERDWLPQLVGLPWKLVIVLPSLEETLARSRQRQKRVTEAHTRAQHPRCAAWDAAVRIDTTGLDVDRSLRLVLARLQDPPRVASSAPDSSRDAGAIDRTAPRKGPPTGVAVAPWSLFR